MNNFVKYLARTFPKESCFLLIIKLIFFKPIYFYLISNLVIKYLAIRTDQSKKFSMDLFISETLAFNI